MRTGPHTAPRGVARCSFPFRGKKRLQAGRSPGSRIILPRVPSPRAISAPQWLLQVKPRVCPRLQWRGPHRYFTDFPGPTVPQKALSAMPCSKGRWGCQLPQCELPAGNLYVQLHRARSGAAPVARPRGGGRLEVRIFKGNRDWPLGCRAFVLTPKLKQFRGVAVMT
jgi:hypothetical protein